MGRQILMAKILSFFIILIFVSSCYEPIDGCIDILSTNYQLDADNECDDCCTYPNTRLILDYNFGEEDFDRSLYYDFGTGDSLRILNSHYFIRDLYLVQDSIKIGSEDSISVLCTIGSSLETQWISNTLEKIRLTSIQVEFANYRSMGSYDSLGFIIGLGDCLSQLETTDNLASEFNDYNNLTASINEEEELVQLYFQLEDKEIKGLVISNSDSIYADTTVSDTIFPNQLFKDSIYLDTIFADSTFQYKCYIKDTTFIRDTFEIELVNSPATSFHFTADIMNDISIDIIDTVHIDVQLWLQGIKSDQSDEERKTLIIENIPNVFRLQ